MDGEDEKLKKPNKSKPKALNSSIYSSLWPDTVGAGMGTSAL